MRRRQFIAYCAGLAVEGEVQAQSRAVGGVPVRIGLTPVFLDNRTAFLSAWREYLQARVGRTVQFIQRGTYREIVDSLRSGAIEFGWICGYPYARYADDLRLLAVPQYRGQPLYQSYVIVPASDVRTNSVLDLRGQVFAYSDPDSNSGYLYPTYLLTKLHERPDAFFRRSFFAWAHRSVVEAVAAALADGGSVDGYVWDTLVKHHPRLGEQTRVVSRSPSFGFPPFVGHANLPAGEFKRMRDVLLGMGGEPTGRALLDQLNLDGFVVGDTRLFDGIREMMQTVKGGSRAALA